MRKFAKPFMIAIFVTLKFVCFC